MNCPVCNSQKASAFLNLKNFPIYQHPVAEEADVSGPFEVDLDYRCCEDCGHVFQMGYDKSLLNDIYENYYYTPRPENIGEQFRKSFIDMLNQQDWCQAHNNDALSVLEIGCSTGEVLDGLKSIFPKARLVGIEPNKESCQVARQKGIEVLDAFMDLEFANNLDQRFDLIYSRHVIEHFYDFKDFFLSITALANPKALMVVETPCLDAAIKNRSISPFHVEHVQVFSKGSLQALAKAFGWQMVAVEVTEVGHMIATFERAPTTCLDAQAQTNSGLPLQSLVEELKQQYSKVSQGKTTVFWGAGSGGRVLFNIYGQVPDHIVDGNVNKTSRRYCGLDKPIEYGPELIKTLIEQGKDLSSLLVIASCYYREISKTIQQLGWRGEVYSPYEAAEI